MFFLGSGVSSLARCVAVECFKLSSVLWRCAFLKGVYMCIGCAKYNTINIKTDL